MKMRDLFLEKLAERVIILFICPKWRKVTKRPYVGEPWLGNIDQKVIKK